jgi:hypothetical protein
MPARLQPGDGLFRRARGNAAHRHIAGVLLPPSGQLQTERTAAWCTKGLLMLLWQVA